MKMTTNINLRLKCGVVGESPDGITEELVEKHLGKRIDNTVADLMLFLKTYELELDKESKYVAVDYKFGGVRWGMVIDADDIERPLRKWLVETVTIALDNLYLKPEEYSSFDRTVTVEYTPVDAIEFELRNEYDDDHSDYRLTICDLVDK